MTATPRALSVKQLAERWSVSDGTIWKLVKDGTLPAFRPGARHTRIALRFVEQYEDGQPYKAINPDPWIRDERGNAVRMGVAERAA